MFWQREEPTTTTPVPAAAVFDARAARQDISRLDDLTGRIAQDLAAIEAEITQASAAEEGGRLEQLWARRRTMREEREDYTARRDELSAQLAAAGQRDMDDWGARHHALAEAVAAERRRLIAEAQAAGRELIARLQALEAHPKQVQDRLAALAAERAEIYQTFAPAQMVEPEVTLPPERELTTTERHAAFGSTRTALNNDSLINMAAPGRRIAGFSWT